MNFTGLIIKDWEAARSSCVFQNSADNRYLMPRRHDVVLCRLNDVLMASNESGCG
jgi:hypothetical protein